MSEATETVISILDGNLGSELDVCATDDGLEFGGYSTLTWDWIDAARLSHFRALASSARISSK